MAANTAAENNEGQGRAVSARVDVTDAGAGGITEGRACQAGHPVTVSQHRACILDHPRQAPTPIHHLRPYRLWRAN